jgi:hypothetical protein
LASHRQGRDGEQVQLLAFLGEQRDAAYAAALEAQVLLRRLGVANARRLVRPTRQRDRERLLELGGAELGVGLALVSDELRLRVALFRHRLGERTAAVKDQQRRHLLAERELRELHDRSEPGTERVVRGRAHPPQRAAVRVVHVEP